MPRTRLTPMATDGQGVVLAVAASADTRQRTTMDLLARRVAHRLGCPVATAQIQRGSVLIDAALDQLAAKGVRQAVVVPIEAFPVAITDADSAGRLPTAMRGNNPIELRVAPGIGGDPAIIDAVLESLDASERTPSPDVAVLLGVPPVAAPIVRRLAERASSVTSAGWAGVGFVRVGSDVAGFEEELSRVAPLNGERTAVLVPLAVNPGPFVGRCEDLVTQAVSPYGDKIAMVGTTLHATPTITRLIKERVVDARRL